jgi:2-polyprenyl-6-methoxyphenol hydroxylase-like FAD-dependent oxidoreductase
LVLAPTGLTLALVAHDHGAQVRIVERRPEAFRPSRALIVHPRMLESLRPYGVVPELLSRADIAPAVRLHVGSRAVTAKLADLAMPDAQYPHLSLMRQADVEAVLSTALAEREVHVERGTEAVAAEDAADGTSATLRSGAATEVLECDRIVGCDGPQSIVRRTARIGWPGGHYGEEVVLANVGLTADLPPGIAHAIVACVGPPESCSPRHQGVSAPGDYSFVMRAYSGHRHRRHTFAKHPSMVSRMLGSDRRDMLAKSWAATRLDREGTSGGQRA